MVDSTAVGSEATMDRRSLLIASAFPLALRLGLPVIGSSALAQTTQQGKTMSEPTQRMVETNGIRINIAEQGKGPLVLLCHGFPESWYSWRHQLGALAAAGFHAVAPDMRGYGKSDAPEAIDQYTIFHLVGDMVGLLDALEAPTRRHRRPRLGRARRLARGAAAPRPLPRRRRASACRSGRAARSRPTSVMPQTADALFYQLYFQEPGVAEAELERDPRATVRNMLYGARAMRRAAAARARRTASAWCREAAASCADAGAPATLPAWLSERDIDFYAGEFAAHRLPRRPQLVSQHRPQLGAAGAVRRRAGDGPGALRRGRPRHGGRLPRHGPAARQSQALRPRAA